MINQLTKEKSDISRTNQLQILPKQDIAEKLYQYLFNVNKGIESFVLKYPPDTTEDNDNISNSNSEEVESFNSEDTKADFYRDRHKYIKNQIKERLARDGKEVEYSDIRYFLSYSEGKNNVFFLSSNKNHSGWKKLFNNNRERILNLVFKFYLLKEVFSTETMNGFEELFFVHSKSLTKSQSKALVVWGQNLLIKYNHYDVLTLNLTRKRRIFLPQDKKDYKTLDGDDLGELLVYKDKNYYFNRNLDARHSNSINFMDFTKDKDGHEKYEKFKKTQLYYYQMLMTRLENFLTECEIEYETSNFQADHYLENPFIKNIESVESYLIINNTGIDLTENDRQFLQNFLKHKGISNLTFYNSGKTISSYKQQEVEGEDGLFWKITEIIPWSNIELDKNKNYLIFNKLLEEEKGSIAYQRDDGLWCASSELKGKSKVDFYSQLKQKYNYLNKGEFYSIQGINIPEFKIISQSKEKNLSVFSYDDSKIEKDNLTEDSQTFLDVDVLLPNVEDCLISYLSKQNNPQEWENFGKTYKLKIAPEFEKVLIEIGIKNWIRESLTNSSLGLPIKAQSFSEQKLWVIYVRSPKNEKEKVVAVEFVYQKDCLYLKSVMHDLESIKKKFTFIRKRKNNSDKLINDQQYFVDESEKLYLSCYTSDYFTPTLIGKNGIIEEMENGTLKINRAIAGENSSKFLPIVSHYNGKIKPIKRIQNMICFDLDNEEFIQYYIPPAKSIESKIKKGFRVYHLIAKKYSGESIPTSKLIEHPLASLHFSTLTHNILKISDNSQSSLLQKIAKVLVEN